MLRHVLTGTIALLAGTALAIAAPKDDVNAAAKKLADANNYTWKQAPQNAAPQGGQGGQGNGQANGQQGGRRRGRGGMMGPMEGKMADGITVLTMGQGENAREIVKKGDKVLFKTADGWQTPEEMEQAAGDNNGRPNPARMMSRMITNMKGPAVEAENLASHIDDLKKDGDAYTGDLTEDGAKSFMTFGGRGGQGPEISNAKGNAKFWIKDGALTKFEYTVSGTMSFNGNDREINRTMVVDISDVGSTKIDVPDDAKKKLE
jgi:hypothetical protein